MNTLTQYILKELKAVFFLTLSVLLGFVWIVQVVKFASPFLKSSESILILGYLIFLTLPDLLAIIVPIALFISMLIVYNRFHVEQEIAVMFSSGYSPWSLAKPALFFSLGATIFMYVLNLVILPVSFQKLRDLELQLKSSLPSVLVQPGVFNSFGDVTIYVHQKEGQSIQGILAHVHSTRKNPYTIMAQEGYLIVRDKMPKIFMFQGVRHEKDLKTGNLSALYFDRTIVSLIEESSSSRLKERPRKPYELTIFELISPQNMTLPHGQRLYAEGYQRLLSPLYPLTFSLIGLTFLLLAPFRRRGQLPAICMATSSVLLLQSTLLFLMNLGAKTGQSILIAYGVIISVIFISVGMLKRIFQDS